MKGYRSEYLFGDGITDPLEVAFYETRDLGNSDIPDMLLKKGITLTDEEREYLETFHEQDEPDKEFFQDIVSKFIGNRNFCKWLCATPADIYYSYVKPLNLKGRELSLELFLETEDITEYDIPEDAVVLADLGREGSLFVWKED